MPQRPLTANVHLVTGKTVHRVATDDGELVLPAPATVRIECGDEGCFLLRLDRTGQCVADTWHGTVEEAMQQAEFEYSIARASWRAEVP